MSVPFTVLIPARYGATRFPGKPLHLLAGRPMIQHVVERARESGARKIVVATDDARIRTVCESFGAEVCMTSDQHRSGTDRLAEVARTLRMAEDEIVVNLQGDEPLMPPQLLTQVAQALHDHRDAAIATLCVPIGNANELHNPNVVKVVTDRFGYALYFSRATIPWARDAFAAQPNAIPDDVRHFRHLGIYAYRAKFLTEFTRLEPAPPELAESLEQLRALWHGHRVHVSVASDVPPPGVDTPEDLVAAEQRIKMASK